MSTQALSPISEKLAFYRRATNYIAVAMIYLQDNHLLEEPLKPEHVKHRLLGHWGTVPGINLMYAGLNRLILDTDASALLVTGPGHGAPANLANLWIDGCLEDVKPEMSRDREGLSKLVRLFSWPGGFPSHIAPIVPGTIHEGGELGYALATAFGAALDNPDLIVACIVGDGEAETGPTAGAWHSNKFLDPATSGAVLPMLHLNGYKIANPTIFSSMSDVELTKLFEGYGWHPIIVQGDDLDGELAGALDTAYGEIRELQGAAREGSRPVRPIWPMLIVKSPKGWTGVHELDGVLIEGTSKSHQVPAMQARTNPEHLQALEDWLRSYGPEELFDANGGPAPEIAAMCPTGERRMGANPHVNGGRMRVALQLPKLDDHAVALERPGGATESSLGAVGEYLAQVFELNREQANFRVVCPDEVASNRLGALFKVENHAYEWPVDPEINPDYKPDGRIMEVLSEHNCQGWLQGYVLTGRHGLFPCYEAFIPIVDGMVNQYGKFLKMSREEAPWREPVASLNYLLTSEGWRQDHNGYSHQMPGFINSMLNRREEHARVYVPPDANTLLATVDHCLQATGCINLIIGSKLPLPQWLSMEEARAHVARRGLGVAVGQQQRRRRARPGAGQLRHDPHDRAARGREPAQRGRAGPEGALRQRHQPVRAGGAGQTPRRDALGRVRRAVHQGSAGDLQLPRLPVGGPPADPPAPAPGALPRARLRRGGHDHDSVRPARDEWRRPLPARDRGAEPRRHRDQRGRRRHVGRVRGAQHRRRPGGDREVPCAARRAPPLRPRGRQRPARADQLGVAGLDCVRTWGSAYT